MKFLRDHERSVGSDNDDDYTRGNTQKVLLRYHFLDGRKLIVFSSLSTSAYGHHEEGGGMMIGYKIV